MNSSLLLKRIKQFLIVFLLHIMLNVPLVIYQSSFGRTHCADKFVFCLESRS